MRIEKAAVIVTSPDRNFVTLRLETDDGVVGLGDGTLNGRELAVVSYLREHVAPLLIGRDAQRIEDTWQFLYRGGYWRRGPVTMAAIAAVDVALWDIKAKAAGMPLYQLLGGASRDGLLAYGHASGQDLPELFGSIQQHLDEGYRAIRVQTGVPGLPSVYGVASSANAAAGAGAGSGAATTTSRPARSDLPVQETGTPVPTCATFRLSSRRCAANSARTATAARRSPPHDADPGRSARQEPRTL